MLAQLATLAILLAAILFLLSLPLGERPAAGALRRAAAFSFILAFVPSILVCAIQPLLPHGRSAIAILEFVFAGLGLIAVLGLLSLAAYGFLDLRSHGRSRQPTAHGERVGYTKERPSHGAHGRGDADEGADAE